MPPVEHGEDAGDAESTTHGPDLLFSFFLISPHILARGDRRAHPVG